MSQRRVRVAILAAAVVAAGLLATLLATAGTAPPRSGDPHADPHLSAAQRTRLLNATAAAAASGSQAALIAQGRSLFRSNRVAKQGESCQGCHTEGGANAGLGTTPHPRFDGDFTGPRDPPTLWDVAHTAPYFWTGSRRTLREAVLDTIVTHFTDGAAQPADVTGRQAAALVAYVSTLRAPRTSFDDGTLSAAAQRGLRLFQTKGGCSGCHGGPDFTDNLEQATCVPQAPGPTIRAPPSQGCSSARSSRGTPCAPEPSTRRNCGAWRPVRPTCTTAASRRCATS